MAPRGRVRREPSESIGRPLSAWTRLPPQCSKPSRRAPLPPRRVDGDVRHLGSARGALASTPQGREPLPRGQQLSAEAVRRVLGSGLTLCWFLRFVRRARVVTRQKACEHPGTEPRNGVSTSLLDRQRRRLNAAWTVEPCQTPHVQRRGGRSQPALQHAYVRSSSATTLSAAKPRIDPTGLVPDYAADTPVSAHKRADLLRYCGDPTAVSAAGKAHRNQFGSALQHPTGPSPRLALVGRAATQKLRE